ncbi:hypothetical protein GDO81_020545 [Engystomops pustulosus]|uniref:Uncharacterized protein n=1 Tax=Engystomops pustulosus TaxID=76066 RepID=A0AAV6YSP4_ENGPU|nr:hypothetical protein GDO81_020545 [Engystomops pustulosus]
MAEALSEVSSVLSTGVSLINRGRNSLSPAPPFLKSWKKLYLKRELKGRVSSSERGAGSIWKGNTSRQLEI